MYYYWKQNKQKFRDVDFEKLAASDKPAIVFTGDSYTEGHGIKHPEDRFQTGLEKPFPNTQFITPENAAGIYDRKKSLIKQLPVKPKIIFLQICSNDWDYLVNNSSYIQAKQTALFADMDFSVSNYSILFNYLKPKSGLLMQNYFGYRLSEEQKKQMTDRFRLYDSAEKLPANPFKAFEYCLSKTTLSDDSIQDVVFPCLKTMTRHSS
jgi:hypothetical protein